MFCSKFIAKLRQWGRKVDEVLISHIDKALEITTAIKTALDSPIAIAVVTVIPHDWDNNLRELASKYLEWALKDLGFFKQLTNEELTLEEKLKMIQDFMKDFTNYEKQSFLIKLASRLTAYFDGSKQENHQYDLLAQVRYSLTK